MRSLDMLHMAAGFGHYQKRLETTQKQPERTLSHTPWNRNHRNLRTMNCSTPETACQQCQFPNHLVKISLATLLNVTIGQFSVTVDSPALAEA